MIGHCFNPKCNEELRYLRQGSVYQWEKGVAQDFHSEFFWLCPACSPIFKVVFDHDGEPSLAPAALKDERGRRGSRIRRVLRDVVEECIAVPVPETQATRQDEAIAVRAAKSKSSLILLGLHRTGNTIHEAHCPVMTVPSNFSG
jgi:hypothetical protein